MYWFFQNLNKDNKPKKLFHFRGTVGKLFRYEICSGPALALEFRHGECCDNDSSSMIRAGLLFFTIYFTFYLPKSWYFQRKCIATWDGGREFWLVQGREYGFYVYEWNVCWRFHAKANESSSSDPWWMKQYWNLREMVLGRLDVIKDQLYPEGKDVKFSLGGKEFVMNEVNWILYRYFYRRIPYSLYHRERLCVSMDIKKPPMHRGKGENSWDCGDDGSYGLHTDWDYERPTYETLDRDLERAVTIYVDHVMKDTKRYGSTSGERGVARDSIFKYIGREKAPSTEDCQAEVPR